MLPSWFLATFASGRRHADQRGRLPVRRVVAVCLRSSRHGGPGLRTKAPLLGLPTDSRFFVYVFSITATPRGLVLFVLSNKRLRSSCGLVLRQKVLRNFESENSSTNTTKTSNVKWLYQSAVIISIICCQWKYEQYENIICQSYIFHYLMFIFSLIPEIVEVMLQDCCKC